jgi:hypothetical protein
MLCGSRIAVIVVLVEAFTRLKCFRWWSWEDFVRTIEGVVSRLEDFR